jgi:DNA-binding transcriptional MerR regulator
LERLRYVLLLQRDQYLPLRVIKENLEALDRGLEPAANGGVATPRPTLATIDTDSSPESFGASSDLRLSREELLKASGLKDAQLVELESYGFIALRGRHYDNDALAVATAVAEMASFGIEARHLRSFKSAADREIGLIEQVITPINRQKSSDSKARAEEVQKQIASLSVRLHASLVRAGLNRPR